MTQSLQLLSVGAPSAEAPGTLVLSNDADPRLADLTCVHTVELHFPVFSDGRAFSQAFLLRRRLGFAGEIRATGDVLIDQLPQMRRSGFSQAVLRADQDAAHGRRLLSTNAGHYQGDATQVLPRFAQATA
ncbi:DUF934 domain-containing protein [Hydrogenophaga sp.]|uniref:DUF934 domain-containing protein n=1 Tax=Hydrogenophaga sp. TaxID=1904254 RepID=UPI0025C68705|nr:DUF934 domain-containing protein [Hydrogenophaga sp.]